jgi:hypothetical protein
LFARFLTDAGRPADEELLHALGEHPVQSVREIMGVVNRLAAAADSLSRPITVELVRRELGGASSPAMPTPRMVTAVQAGQPFLDMEKVVWDWPDTGARLIEEVR